MAYANIHRIQRTGTARTVAIFGADGSIQATTKLMPYNHQPEDCLVDDWKELAQSLTGITHIAVKVQKLKLKKVLSAIVTAEDGDYTIEVDTDLNSHYKLDWADEVKHIM